MPDCSHRMVQQHPRPRPPHDGPDALPHVGTVAVDRASAACGLIVWEFAFVKPPERICQQVRTLPAKCPVALLVTAVEPCIKCNCLTKISGQKLCNHEKNALFDYYGYSTMEIASKIEMVVRENLSDSRYADYERWLKEEQGYC